MHGDRPTHFNAWSQRKAELKRRLPKGMPAWVFHDLRRTARSLMARAKVADAVAERVIGHKQGGVQGIYNRHTYNDEKGEALKQLAAEIDKIIHPTEGNVVPLRG
jgi:integrase